MVNAGLFTFDMPRAFFGFTDGLHDWNLAFVPQEIWLLMTATSGVMIPFGSLRERSGVFKCCKSEHFSTFYDSCAF